MWCFISSCFRQSKDKFDCYCGQSKHYCEKHEKSIIDQRKSCELGWRCISCKKGAVNNDAKFIGVTSDNDVQFSICSTCLLEALDPWLASYFEELKENDQGQISRARSGQGCEKCGKHIATDLYSEDGGWTWNDNYINHAYCYQCIKHASKQFL